MTVTPYVIDTGGETFAAGDPPHGVCWSPTDSALEPDPTWVRMDDPDGVRLASGWSVTRGRNSEQDKTVTGTASIGFNDRAGDLDPTNPSGPWYGDIDPMKQAAIALMNPVTGDWHTVFRGFIGGPDHELEMYEAAARGLNVVTWNCVDAFDLFSNVVLTRGRHGHTPSLTDFPNIYYQGTPSNLPGVADVFWHVDDRIALLLDDALWPKDTGAPNPKRAGLRNIFSGNVSVQGVVMGRVDTLMQALQDAADAEMPSVANHFISRTGVYTFHGRYARFFPDRPGYGINRWYVGGGAEAALDPDVAPLSGALSFYRSKDDVINSCMALPQGTDPTDTGVVLAEDATSKAKYGFRSMNFEGLLTSAGHTDAGAPTTAVQECNKVAAYFVGNYKTTHDRVRTLRFRSRGAGTVGAAALWDLMTRVELGDVVTLTTGHVGGGGFGSDFYVEQIRYVSAPMRRDMRVSVTLELEVSPATFYAYNPFGTVDTGAP